MTNETMKDGERAAWEETRQLLGMAIAGFVDRPAGARGLAEAKSMLDAITQQGLPLNWLRAASPQSGEKCPACAGNDGDTPCAFPKGGQLGCLRDARLARAAAPQAALTDEQIEKAADADSSANGYGADDGLGIPCDHWWTFDRGGLKKFARALLDRAAAPNLQDLACQVVEAVSTVKDLHDLVVEKAGTAPQSGAKGDEHFRAAVEEMVALLENGEWSEHVAESIANGDELASRLETAITELHNDIGTVREARAAALTDEQIMNIADSYSFTWDEGIVAFARAIIAATKEYS